MRYARVDSPIGELLLVGDGRALRGLSMQDGDRPAAIDASWSHDPPAFEDVREQLVEYFAGRRSHFELRLDTGGTAFQRDVWRELRQIPYGETVTYGELARRVGRPAAVRAVGAANGANPIAVVVPCHRVVAADGSLTGFAGGLARKRLLLDLERRRSASA